MAVWLCGEGHCSLPWCEAPPGVPLWAAVVDAGAVADGPDSLGVETTTIRRRTMLTDAITDNKDAGPDDMLTKHTRPCITQNMHVHYTAKDTAMVRIHMLLFWN